jgi:hypothetical protein
MNGGYIFGLQEISAGKALVPLYGASGHGEIVAESELMPGVIGAIQRFGKRINLHPHLHFLVTEGGVDESGVFHKISRIDDSRLAELFAREVLTSHIPDKGQVTIRYFGRYANAHRRKVWKACIETLPLRIVEDQSRPVPSKGWAEMIRA